MSDLFENIELQMQADAKEKNPRSAILASQMETEKRFGNFIDENVNRVSIIEKEIKDVTDKFAYQYDVDPKMVYEATVSYLTKNAENFMPEENEGPVIAPGIEDYLKVMKEAGFEELATDWEQKLSSLDMQNQVDLYGEIVDSFVEAVESRPVTDMWENDPNQYEEWDRTASAHKDLSDEELLNKIKNLVQQLKRLEEPMGEDLEELHQELWDRSGHGDKWRNRNKSSEETDEENKEEKTAGAGNYAAYQIKGNDHFLCPHCAQEMTGDNLEWEDSLSPISQMEMSDISKYTGHSGKCDQCGMDLIDKQREASVENSLLPIGQKLISMAEQSGHSKLADKWVEDWMNPETSAEGAHEKIASAARQLWEVLKGDRRPEVREFYSNNKNELVDLMTEANLIAYEINPQRISTREASVSKFIGIEDEFIKKEAMQLYSGPIWDELKRRWQSYPVGPDGRQPLQEVEKSVGRPDPYPAGANKRQQYEIPNQTWHDYIMRSNLYGQKGYPLRSKGVDADRGPLPPNMNNNPNVNNNNPDDQITQDMSGAGGQGDGRNNDQMVKGLQGNPPPNQTMNPKRRKKMMEGLTATSSLTPIEEKLIEVYMNKGLNEKYASIIVESVGEMAQLQVSAPGLPVASEDSDSVNIDKEIGGKEGDKYRNINVEETSKAIGVEHQDPGPEYEDVREFVQPGGEAPYADNDERTEKNKDKYKGEADRSKMDGKGVKQEDNVPKQSSRKISDSSEEWMDYYNERYPELIEEGHGEDDAHDLAIEYADYMIDKKQGVEDDYFLDHQSPQEVYDEVYRSPYEER